MDNHPYVILEEVIKKQYIEDRFDPKMYQAIFDLSEKVILFRKMADTRSAIDEIAHECSKTIWTRVKRGTEIEAWTKYIMLELRSTSRQYRSSVAGEVVEIDDPVELEEYLHREYYSKVRSELNDHYVLSFLASVPDIILEHIKRLSHFSDVIHIRCLYLTVIHQLRGGCGTIGLENTRSMELHISYITSIIYEDLASTYRELVRSLEGDYDLDSIMINEMSEGM